MSESMHDFVVRKLQEARPAAWPGIAAASGVSLRTIEKVARRVYKSHRLSTMEPLAERLGYFEQRRAQRGRTS